MRSPQAPRAFGLARASRSWPVVPGQLGAGPAGGVEAAEQLAVLVGPVLLQGGHQLGDLHELAVDVLRAQVQLGRARPGVLVQAVAHDGDHGVDRGLDRGLPLHGEVTAEVLGQHAQNGDGDEAAHEQGTDDGDDHAPIMTRGCDRNPGPPIGLGESRQGRSVGTGCRSSGRESHASWSCRA